MVIKYFFTVMIVFVASFAKAQIVNIPDSNFKYLLLNYVPVIDTNNDGEIQVAEALNVINLYATSSVPVTDRPIKNLTGLEAFSNLQFLFCDGLHIDTLNISGLHQLKTLTCRTTVYLHKLIANTNDSLAILTLGAHNVDSIDLRSCKNLQSFGSDLNYSLLSVNLSGLTKLNQIDIAAYSMNSLKLRDCSSLITQVIPSSNSLSDLDLTGCTGLTSLSIGDTRLTSLDMGTCTSLSDLSIGSFKHDTVCYLNIKNGASIPRVSIWSNQVNLLNICADEPEVDAYTRYFSSTYPGLNINISSYCSFFPGGLSNTINGNVKIDLNSNGCDVNDSSVNNLAIKISDTAGYSSLRYTINSGLYNCYTRKGIYSLTPYFPYPYFVVNPASATVNFDTANNLTAIRDFCIQPNGIHNDLEITFLPVWPPARPGFNAAYTITYKNRGTTTLSGNVQLNFDNSKMNFFSASENIATQSTGQLTWNYNNLQPFESKTINVTFNLLPPPVNNIGDTINYLAAITPSAGDETQFDNSFILPQRVIGSFDPNDKQCLEGSKLDISKIGDYLHYQIRFQNEGTDTAFNVVVADTLSDKLDWSTFEFIKASHPVDVRLNNNKAEFIFENIQLPYKAINEPASNGWVAFKIKPKPSVVIGDSLNNSAAIYFDFNLPIITNTATTIVSNSSSPVPVKLEYFSINKKGNSNQLNWKASCTSTSATFVIETSDDGMHFKSIGNISATALRCQLPFNFNDNNPTAGKNYYRIKITDAEGKSFYSKVLVVGNNKAGLEIKAVANNTVYISNNKQQTVQMKVIAADGKEIWNERKVVLAGDNNIALQIKNAAKGIYTLLVYMNEGETIVRKFVK